jgi:hypothetical protein
MVITKDDLFICLLEDDIIRDWVPLVEIQSVQNLSDNTEQSNSFSSRKTTPRSLIGGSANSASSHSLKDEKYLFLAESGIVISTEEDGHNSGRKYYIRTDSEDVRDSVAFEIKKFVKEARTKVRGKIPKWKEAISSFQESWIVQFLSAFVIVAVSERHLVVIL